VHTSLRRPARSAVRISIRIIDHCADDLVVGDGGVSQISSDRIGIGTRCDSQCRAVTQHARADKKARAHLFEVADDRQRTGAALGHAVLAPGHRGIKLRPLPGHVADAAAQEYFRPDADSFCNTDHSTAVKAARRCNRYNYPDWVSASHIGVYRLVR